MKAMLEMLNSFEGAELALYCVLLIACQYCYVALANNSDAGFELYAAAWFMAVLTAMAIIKAIRFVTFAGSRD